jgi:hypothetical protein
MCALFEGYKLATKMSRNAIRAYDKRVDTTPVKLLLSDNDKIAELYGTIHNERIGTVLANQLFSNYMAV